MTTNTRIEEARAWLAQTKQALPAINAPWGADGDPYSDAIRNGLDWTGAALTELADELEAQGALLQRLAVRAGLVLPEEET